MSMKREYDFSHAKRGAAVQVPKGKTRITIRLDDDLVDWFRQQVGLAGGGNYQSLINDALRQHVRRVQESRWRPRFAVSSGRNSATPVETKRAPSLARRGGLGRDDSDSSEKRKAKREKI